jgi:hypothetical protein
MALPVITNMDFEWAGQPFVHVEAKPLNTASLDFEFMGQPFVAGVASNNGRTIRPADMFLIFRTW